MGNLIRGCRMIIKRLAVGPLQTNCYIVGAENKEGVIIDPGEAATHILNTVKSLGLKVKYIILTHAHIDHIGALKAIKEATGASVAIHEDEAAVLPFSATSDMLGLEYPAPEPPDVELHDGDKLQVGELSFTVLHTPGHSPGAICLLCDGVLFSGDTLFQGGVGRYDFPGGSYDKLMDSLKNTVLKLDDRIKVYPGHGPETDIGSERRGNPFLEF